MLNEAKLHSLNSITTNAEYSSRSRSRPTSTSLLHKFMLLCKLNKPRRTFCHYRADQIIRLFPVPRVSIPPSFSVTMGTKEVRSVEVHSDRVLTICHQVVICRFHFSMGKPTITVSPFTPTRYQKEAHERSKTTAMMHKSDMENNRTDCMAMARLGRRQAP